MNQVFTFSDFELDMARILSEAVGERPKEPLSIHPGQHIKIIGVLPEHVRGLYNLHRKMLSERDELNQRLERLNIRAKQVYDTITDSIRATHKDLGPNTLFCVPDKQWHLGIVLQSSQRATTRKAQLKQSSSPVIVTKGTKTKQ